MASVTFTRPPATPTPATFYLELDEGEAQAVHAVLGKHCSSTGVNTFQVFCALEDALKEADVPRLI